MVNFVTTFECWKTDNEGKKQFYNKKESTSFEIDANNDPVHFLETLHNKIMFK